MNRLDIALCYTDKCRETGRCDICEDVEECNTFISLLRKTNNLNDRGSLHALFYWIRK